MYVNSLCELCLIAEHTENLSVCSWKYTEKKNGREKSILLHHFLHHLCHLFLQILNI